MPKELFNGNLITGTNEPADDDRIAFGQPGVSGSKNIVWSYFKQLLQSALQWLDLIPQATDPGHNEGRIYYDNVLKTHIAMNDQSDVRLSIGSEMWARLENVTGGNLLNGKVGYVSGANAPFLQCDLAVASDKDNALRTIGLFTQDIADSAQGYITVYGAVRGVNTSAWPVNTVLWLDPDTPGELTNIRPSAPNYPVRMGVVISQDAVNGVIGVDTLAFTGSDTSVNVEGLLNGIVTQTPDIAISSNGTTITATVTNQDFPGESLPFLLGGERYNLPTGQSVTIPPGADDETLQGSIIYIYLNSGVPTLAIATTPPSIPYCTLAELAVFDAVRTQSDGRPFSYRRSNNAIDNKNGVNDGALGLFIRTLNAIRKKLGSNWISGQDATPTVNNTSIQVTLTAGRAMQFNEGSIPVFAGGEYIVYNDITNQVTYEEFLDLINITSDANGGTFLANGRYYTIRLFQLFNSNGVGNSIIATRPLGSYTTANEAIQDASNYTVNVNDTLIEEIIYPLYDLVIGRTGAGGSTVSLIQLTNLRTKLIGGTGGGGASGGGGTDDKVRVSATDTTNDYLNAKIAAGAGIKKTIDAPAANEQVNLSIFEVPTTEPEIVTGTPNTLTLDLNSHYQALFEPRLSTITRTININFDLVLSNITNARLLSVVLSLTGTITIDMPNDVLVSNASSIGIWDETLKQLELTTGTDDIIELQFLRDKTGSQWLLKVSEVPLT